MVRVVALKLLVEGLLLVFGQGLNRAIMLHVPVLKFGFALRNENYWRFFLRGATEAGQVSFATQVL